MYPAISLGNGPYKENMRNGLCDPRAGSSQTQCLIQTEITQLPVEEAVSTYIAFANAHQGITFVSSERADFPDNVYDAVENPQKMDALAGWVADSDYVFWQDLVNVVKYVNPTPFNF